LIVDERRTRSSAYMNTFKGICLMWHPRVESDNSLSKSSINTEKHIHFRIIYLMLLITCRFHFECENCYLECLETYILTIRTLWF